MDRDSLTIYTADHLKNSLVSKAVLAYRGYSKQDEYVEYLHCSMRGIKVDMSDQEHISAFLFSNQLAKNVAHHYFILINLSRT